MTLNATPEPIWPVLFLAAIQLGDAALCVRPVGFVAKCFKDVGWPRRFWWLMTPTKLAAAAGLLAGVWVPWLGLATAIALVAYFIVAIGMHVQARDFGRNLFVNASGMEALCLAVVARSFLTW